MTLKSLFCGYELRHIGDDRSRLAIGSIGISRLREALSNKVFGDD